MTVRTCLSTRKLASGDRKERRIGRLVDDGGRRHEPGQFGHDIELRRRQQLPRGDLPALEIWPPLPRRFFWRCRRDEAGEDRTFGMAVNDIGNRRKHSLHPRRLPNSSPGKNPLHVDAQVDGILDRLGRLIVLRQRLVHGRASRRLMADRG
jgi:hypothetical protein